MHARAGMPVVMVVDDDRDMLDLYATVLEDFGYQAVLRSEPNPDPDAVLAAGADAVVIDLQAESDQTAGLRAIEVLRSSPATHAIPIILGTAAPDQRSGPSPTDCMSSTFPSSGSPSVSKR